MITVQQSYWLLGPGFSQNVYRITAVPMKQKKNSRQIRDTRFAKNTDDILDWNFPQVFFIIKPIRQSKKSNSELI